MLKKSLKLIVVIFLFFWISSTGFAKTYSNEQIDRIYNSFVLKLEKKYDKTKEISILKKLDNRLKTILETKKLKTSTEDIINRLIYLNNLYLNKLEDNIYKKFEDISKIDNSAQIRTENRIYDFLQKQANSFNKASYINDLIEDWKKFYYTNKNFEYTKDNNIYKFNFTNYYKIDSWNYTQFKSKNWIIIYSETLGYAFLENYSTEKKIRYSNPWKNILWVITDNKRYILENSTYYLYKFTNYSHISDVYWFYLSDLVRFWYTPSKTLLYKDSKNKFNFVTKYEKIKLINDKDISDIENKALFLKIMSDDFTYLNKDYRLQLKEIKNTTDRITKWKSDEEKIKAIYDWILDNITYSSNFKLTDYFIFSWLETYKNKSWVCEWYIKLTTYMLLYAWINNVEDIRWYVIDAKDFPEIWHAWLRIWNEYYDPTFDDPIWATETRKYEEYKYFKLPKDLFYTNRYDYWKLPEYIKSLSLEKRKEIIFNNLAKLVDKYNWKNYLLLKPFEFRKKYNLPLKQLLTISDLKNVLKYYYVDDYKFYDERWQKRYITSIVYYQVDDSTIEKVLADNFNYKIDWLYLFKWKDSNWNISYRLTNKVDIK